MAFSCIAQGNPEAWSMFRGGPELAGVREVPLKPPLMLLWSFKTGAAVKSSAAVADGRVFVGSNDGLLYALEAATGQKLWSFKTGGAVESSPLLLGQAVFFGSADKHLYALECETGKLLWKAACGDKILGSPNAVFIQKPAVETTSAELAKTTAVVAKTAEPVSIPNAVVIGGYDNQLHCFDAATGEPLWTYDTGNYINGAPAVAAGQVVFGGCDGKIHALNAQDGKLLGEVDAGAYIAGSCAVQKKAAKGNGNENADAIPGRPGLLAFAGHYGNEVVCADLETGEIVWRFEESKQPFFSTPAVTETQVFIGGRDRRLYALERPSGKKAWAFPTRGVVDSSPVVCGDQILFGSSDGWLYLLDRLGKPLWSYEIGKSLTASPAVSAGRVFIGGEDGVVYAFETAR